MVPSAVLCVCGIGTGIKYSKTSGINTAGFAIFYTKSDSADTKGR